LLGCATDFVEPKCQQLNDEIAQIQVQRSFIMEQYERVIDNGGRAFAGTMNKYYTAFHFVSAGALTISFALSLWITLALLKSMERVRPISLVVCAVDVFLALLIPVVVLTFVVSLIGFLVPTPSFPELVTGEQFEVSLADYLAIFMLLSSFFPILVANIYYQMLWYDEMTLERFFQLWSILSLWGFSQLKAFFLDLVTVFQGGWRNVSMASAQRNWTIGLSFLFSFTYIVSVSFLLIGRRSALLRGATQKVLQYLAEHERGPIAAISVLLGGALFLADRFAK
jgi:hypothetical protein